MNLKMIRKKAKLTQKEMASKLSIPYNTYLSYEYGYRNPSKFAQEHIEIVTRGLLDEPSRVATVSVRNLIKPKEEKNERRKKLW